MDGYKSRKAPNVSHFLANLNTLPSQHEVANQQQDDFNIEEELAQFTNTEFLDFDAGELPMPDYDPSLEEKARREIAAANNKISGKGMDLVAGMCYRTPQDRRLLHRRHQFFAPQQKISPMLLRLNTYL